MNRRGVSGMFEDRLGIIVAEIHFGEDIEEARGGERRAVAGYPAERALTRGGYPERDKHVQEVSRKTNGLNRVQGKPEQFGRYQVPGRDIIAASIDEDSVESDLLRADAGEVERHGNGNTVEIELRRVLLGHQTEIPVQITVFARILDAVVVLVGELLAVDRPRDEISEVYVRDRLIVRRDRVIRLASCLNPIRLRSFLHPVRIGRDVRERIIAARIRQRLERVMRR